MVTSGTRSVNQLIYFLRETIFKSAWPGPVQDRKALAGAGGPTRPIYFPLRGPRPGLALDFFKTWVVPPAWSIKKSKMSDDPAWLVNSFRTIALLRQVLEHCGYLRVSTSKIWYNLFLGQLLKTGTPVRLGVNNNNNNNKYSLRPKRTKSATGTAIDQTKIRLPRE